MHVWQVGKTKVFLRAGQMAELDARRAEVLGNAARKIQRQTRTYIARKEFILLRNAAVILQSFLRGIFFWILLNIPASIWYWVPTTYLNLLLYMCFIRVN